MREPDTTSAWQDWDAEHEDDRTRRRAAAARTEDELLDLLREAGGLESGLTVLRFGLRARLTAEQRELIAAARRRRQQEQIAALASPPSPEQLAAYEPQSRRQRERLAAFRRLGHGPALSDEWRRAMGNHWSPESGYDHDYEAAVRAELAARRALEETR